MEHDSITTFDIKSHESYLIKSFYEMAYNSHVFVKPRHTDYFNHTLYVFWWLTGQSDELTYPYPVVS